MMRSAMTSTLLALAFGAVACATLPVGPSQRQGVCADHAWYADVTAAPEPGLQLVILLVREADEDVRQLQDRLLLALEGTAYELVRRSDNFPIVTLRVGEDAFCRLIASPLVEGMQRDEPETTGDD